MLYRFFASIKFFIINNNCGVIIIIMRAKFCCVISVVAKINHCAPSNTTVLAGQLSRKVREWHLSL